MFVEALLTRVTRVRDGKVQRKVVTKTPYKMQGKNDAVIMSAEERLKRSKGSRIAARHAKDKKVQADKKRDHSNHIRNMRHIEDRNEINH